MAPTKKKYENGYKIMNIRLFLRVFFRRLRFAFRLREIWGWEYENCGSCGSANRLTIELKDDVWVKVNGRFGGCLCVDCFLQIASSKGIRIRKEDFTWMWAFNPKMASSRLSSSNDFDIINDRPELLKGSITGARTNG